jgi:ribosomal protein L37AE/L43A
MTKIVVGVELADADPFYCPQCAKTMTQRNAPPPPPTTSRLNKIVMIRCPACAQELGIPRSSDPIRCRCSKCAAQFVALPDGTVEILPPPDEKPKPKRPSISLAAKIVEKLKNETKPPDPPKK